MLGRLFSVYSGVFRPSTLVLQLTANHAESQLISQIPPFWTYSSLCPSRVSTGHWSTTPDTCLSPKTVGFSGRLLCTSVTKLHEASYLAYSSLSCGWAGRTCSGPAEFGWLEVGPGRWSQGGHQCSPETQRRKHLINLLILLFIYTFLNGTEILNNTKSVHTRLGYYDTPSNLKVEASPQIVVTVHFLFF